MRLFDKTGKVQNVRRISRCTFLYGATDPIRTDDLWLYIRGNVLCCQIRDVNTTDEFIVNVYPLAFTAVRIYRLFVNRDFVYKLI